MIASTYDVTIVGAGPAGAAAAITLRRAGLSVLIVHARQETPFRIGEGLPPSARSLLRELGILEATLNDGHRPSHGTQAVWGSSEWHYHDFIFQVQGSGIQLDRARFDATLRREAQRRGATLINGTARLVPRPTKEGCAEHTVEVRCSNYAHAVQSRWLIDASGRSASLARKLGATRSQLDDLLAFYLKLNNSSADDTHGSTWVEAVNDGWWYSVLLPSGERLVSFLGDADLVARRSLLTPHGFRERLRDARHLFALCQRHGYRITGVPRGVEASSSRLEPLVGAGWLAVGDAALSFDPLSSKGISNALYTGIRGARAVLDALNGDRAAPRRYAAHLRAIFDVYSTQLHRVYAAERRFVGAPFWERRHQRGADAAPLS